MIKINPELIKNANEGDVKSQVALGKMYLSNKDTNNAYKYFKLATEAGEVDGMYCLAKCYQLGIGIKQDKKKAVDLLTKASKKGHLYALQDLGKMDYKNKEYLKALVKLTDAYFLGLEASKKTLQDIDEELDDSIKEKLYDNLLNHYKKLAYKEVDSIKKQEDGLDLTSDKDLLKLVNSYEKLSRDLKMYRPYVTKISRSLIKDYDYKANKKAMKEEWFSADDKALDYLIKAVSLNSPKAIKKLSEYKGSLDGAIEKISKVLKANKDNLDAKITLATITVSQVDFAKLDDKSKEKIIDAVDIFKEACLLGKSSAINNIKEVYSKTSSKTILNKCLNDLREICDLSIDKLKDEVKEAKEKTDSKNLQEVFKLVDKCHHFNSSVIRLVTYETECLTKLVIKDSKLYSELLGDARVKIANNLRDSFNIIDEMLVPLAEESLTAANRLADIYINDVKLIDDNYRKACTAYNNARKAGNNEIINKHKFDLIDYEYNPIGFYEKANTYLTNGKIEGDPTSIMMLEKYAKYLDVE